MKDLSMKRCKTCLGKPCVLKDQPVGPYIAGAHVIGVPLPPGELNYFQKQDYLRKLLSFMLFVKNPRSRFIMSNSEFVSLKYRIKDKIKENEKQQIKKVL